MSKYGVHNNNNNKQNAGKDCCCFWWLVSSWRIPWELGKGATLSDVAHLVAAELVESSRRNLSVVNYECSTPLSSLKLRGRTVLCGRAKKKHFCLSLHALATFLRHRKVSLIQQ